MYLSYVDGIRALAVISVFLYHLNPNLLPGGFSGVDVFFVVSGFVVSLSLDKYKDVKLHKFLTIFYSRRVKRIIPPLIFCLLITIFVSSLFIPDSYLSSNHWKVATFAFFGLSNIVLAAGNNSYFGPLAEYNPFTHTWSLGVEEQFYLIFPFIFIFWTIQKRSCYKSLSVFLFSLLFFASIVSSFYFSRTNKLYEYYLILGRFWELASGILLYQFLHSKYRGKVRLSEKTFSIISWISLLAIFAGFAFSDKGKFPIPWGILPVAGTFFLLLSIHYLNSGNVKRLLNNQTLVNIGKISYSLYLWHWPVIVLFRWTVGLDTFFKIFFVVAITFLMAIFSYHIVEKPVRTSPIVANSPRYAVILVGIFVVVFSSGIGLILFKAKDFYTLSITKNRPLWYPWSFAEDGAEPKYKATGHQENFAGGSKNIFSCPKAPLSLNKIFVLGDSHATAYTGMFHKYSENTGSETIIYSFPGCGDIITRPFSDMPSDCREFLSSSLNDIRSNGKPGDILFLASLKLRRFTEQSKSFDIKQVKESMLYIGAKDGRDHAALDNLEKITPLAEYGIKVVYEAPKPIFKAPLFRCSEWYNAANPICKEGFTIGKEELLDYRRPVMDSLNYINSKIVNSYIYDPFQALCPDDTCSAISDGKPLFFDGDHLSGYGNSVVYDDFKNFLDNVVSSKKIVQTTNSIDKKDGLQHDKKKAGS